MVVHVPVLLQEVIDGLQAKAGETILDATVGGGGHSEALCRAMGSGRFVCLDADEDAIERSRKRLGTCSCEFLFYRTYYRDLDKALESFRVARIDRALFDLGLSSFQLDTPEGERGRGFSFMRDEPLEMTFHKIPPPRLEDSALPLRKGGEEETITAAHIVNEWGEETIATILFGYGEEKQARRIAARIAQVRQRSPIRTTKELAELIESVVKRRGKIHPATKTFQALRMAVNDEFQGLKMGIGKAFDALQSGGRMAVVSFHSIEDRTVKDFFRDKSRAGEGTLVTKKPLTPAAEEKARNPRSRSAKLRIIEKI